MSESPLRTLRRQQILTVARTLVAESGLSALTIGAIESRVDFTRGVITYHFKNKDEILMAVLRSAIEEIDTVTFARVAERDGLEEKLVAVVEGMVDGFISRAEANRILVAFWGQMDADPRARQVNAELYSRYRHLCGKLLATTGAPDDQVRHVSGLFVGAVIGIVMQHLFEPGSIDVSASVRIFARSLLADLVSSPSAGWVHQDRDG